MDFLQLILINIFIILYTLFQLHLIIISQLSVAAHKCRRNRSSTVATICFDFFKICSDVLTFHYNDIYIKMIRNDVKMGVILRGENWTESESPSVNRTIVSCVVRRIVK